MRVVHVVDSAGLYGAERVILQLLIEQRRLGHTADLISIGTPGCGDKPIENEARASGATVHPLRMIQGPNLLGAFRLAQLAQRESADIIHSHGYKSDILLGLLPSRVRKIPVVATVHGFTATGGVNRKSAYRWLDLLALRRFGRVVMVHGKMIGIRGLDRIAEQRRLVIENGIDALGGAPESPTGAIAQFCSRRPVIGAAGRLSPEKGFAQLVRAFAETTAQGVEARLVILGEGPERPALEALVESLGIQDRVLMPGFVEARPLLPLFDIFVLPSLSEGLPLIVLEAMQAAIPIVATRVGGVPDVLGNGAHGTLVDPGNVTDLGHALSKVIGSLSQAKERAVLVRDEVAGRYTASRMAARYLDAYRDLVREEAQP